MAERPLLARLRWIRARIVAAQAVRSADAIEQHAQQLASLRRREATASEDGVTGALAELGAPDV